MEVILLERVEKLGAIGDVVTVKNGFARNFLLPNKKALRANAANSKLFEANRAKIESDNADRRVEAEAASKDVDGKTVQLIRQASNTGQLYGSVSARDIVEALDAEGAKVTKSQVVLGRPIKAIGMHEVKVVLHPEVVGDRQGQRRPLARRGRAAGAGRRRHGVDVRTRRRRLHRGLRSQRRARHDRRRRPKPKRPSRPPKRTATKPRLPAFPARHKSAAGVRPGGFFVPVVRRIARRFVASPAPAAERRLPAAGL